MVYGPGTATVTCTCTVLADVNATPCSYVPAKTTGLQLPELSPSTPDETAPPVPLPLLFKVEVNLPSVNCFKVPDESSDEPENVPLILFVVKEVIFTINSPISCPAW
jgi:hypothetical protein